MDMCSHCKEEILKLVNELHPREKKVIHMRYGFNGGMVYTLREVGMTLNITRERVRQIEWRTLEKLRKRIKENDEAFEREATKKFFVDVDRYQTIKTSNQKYELKRLMKKMKERNRKK